MIRKFYQSNIGLSHYIVFLAAFVFLALAGQYSFAQEGSRNSGTTSSQPIEIKADDALEWDRENQTYTAQGKAVATQGDTSVHAETLIADYKKGEDGSIQIWKLTALKGVELRAPEGTAFGDKAIYLIEDGRAEMTGEKLTLKNPDQIITAKDRFEYYADEDKFIAIGDVIVKREEDTLKADKAITFFKTDENEERTLDRLEAEGNVEIITPEETLTGRVGNYDPQSEIAELIGNVKIVRGPNVLTGNRATADLKTNISRVYGAPKAGERVKGIFFPQNKDDTKVQDKNNKAGPEDGKT